MCTASTHSHAAQSPVNISCVNHHCGGDKTFGGLSPLSLLATWGFLFCAVGRHEKAMTDCL